MRWKYEDCPFPIKFKETKPKIHPEIHNFDEMPEDQKKVLLEVKSYIRSVMPDARLFLFGSRMNGNWDEESDYDLVILTQEGKEKIDIVRGHDFGVELDLFFVKEHSDSRKVEIKD